MKKKPEGVVGFYDCNKDLFKHEITMQRLGNKKEGKIEGEKVFFTTFVARRF